MKRLPSSPRVRIVCVSIDTLTENDVIARVQGFVESGEGHQIITANPLMILAAEKDHALRAAFEGADLVIPDSAGVQWAARLQGQRINKISGIDLMDRLCAESAVRHWRVFFLGASPGVAETTAKKLTERHQGLLVAGTHHGYFPQKTGEEAVIQRIADAKPDLLFVALPTPFQDGWIHRNLNRLGAKVVMGVGGSFDVLSGRLRRAPSWMRAAGMEWFFRLLQEPSRADRMLRLPLFAWKVLWEPCKKNRKK